MANGVENSLRLISSTAAIEALQSQRPVAPGTLRTFMNDVGDKISNMQAEFTRSRAYSYGEPKKRVGVMPDFSRILCDLLLEADDSALVNEFFTKVCSNARAKDNLVPTIIALVRKYQWSDISQAVLSSLEEKTEATSYSFGRMTEVGDASLVVKLQILDGLDDGSAKLALLQSTPADKSTFDTLAEKFQQLEPSQLRLVVEAISEHVGGIDSSDEKFEVLTSIAAVRMTWLKSQVQGHTVKPFSWEMPNAVFPDNARIQAFLRGHEMPMTTTGVRVFSGLPAARKYANSAQQTNCSFKMEPGGRGKDAYVTITKTRTWYNKQHGDAELYKDELKLLTDRFGDVTSPPLNVLALDHETIEAKVGLASR
ncbi:hypothetical protein F444_17935 [Phytophthora nicotianae P1976]|uniref:Uncharacterized protein n=1 Tax=Phytophthora nicotianae P1976 TaxID=1317066 RepID=A0A080ZD50_PHYNI|nr:hypothetical protein F444_17935 [Phytophthora nicotianae P1976]